jgi:dimethylaniline monooxygenase (N-oxide forming)
LDELAEMIGAKPDLWSIFKKDPKLAYEVFFGSLTPAQIDSKAPTRGRTQGNTS